MKILPFLSYRVTDQAVEVLLGSRLVRRILLSDIESVRRGVTLWNEHWDRRLDLRRTAVTIRRKTGLFRNFQVTPDDPEGFIAEIERARKA
jgi:hypothetical protein